jgi:hypothetical protein
MENVKKYTSFIKRLVTTLPHIRKKMLTTSNHNIIKAICEIILNIYYKHIPLSVTALQSLKKHKVILHQLISSSKSKGGLEAKKQLLIKHSDSFIAIKEIFITKKK